MTKTKILNRFRPLDIAFLSYIAIQILLISLFTINKPGWYFFYMFYFAAAGIGLIFTLFPLPDAGMFWRGLRITYPLFLFLILYSAIGPLIFMIFDQPFDGHIVALEKAVFGVDPAFAVQPYMEVWINEIMSFGYISFFVVFPLTAVILLVKRKWMSLEVLTLSSSLVFYVNCLLFICYPTVGPSYYLSDYYYLPLVGPILTPLAANLIRLLDSYYIDIVGRAMPSLFCAISLVAVYILASEAKKLRFIVIPLFLLFCVASVYGRYHYVSGIIVGLAIGWLGLLISRKWQATFKVGENVSICAKSESELKTVGTKE
ncbi:MAG: phosphatase PAP2 family protein [candidate division Zixibacteria bacterium]